MTLHSARRLRSLAVCAIALAVSGNALAAKAIPTVYADVAITFAGQTYAFGGWQQSFALAEDGGRIVFDLTTLGSPDYLPLPEIGSGGLPAAGNEWEVVTRVGHTSYHYSGICASQTFSSTEAGIPVRHLFLNCESLSTSKSQ